MVWQCTRLEVTVGVEIAVTAAAAAVAREAAAAVWQPSHKALQLGTQLVLQLSCVVQLEAIVDFTL